METAKRVIRRQFSTGSIKHSRKFNFVRSLSFDPRLVGRVRFAFGRQSSLDPNRRLRSRSPVNEGLGVPDNLDNTMQLLFMASQGDAKAVEGLLKDGVDVNSIDLDGRTALHIAACEGHVAVAKLLLSWKANVDARDRWGSTAAADAKYYGNMEVYNMLKARGAKVPRIRKTPMAVSNPQEIPEYELNPGELQFRRGEEVLKGTYQVAKWNGTKVCVKILDRESYSDPESINAFKHELEVLEKVRHPNVVQFVGAVTQNIPMMIVSEYHPKGDLGGYLQKKKLKPQKVLRFALDIARGMNYLHECKPDPIIHCDLTPKNILLDYAGQMKVAGFGLIRLSKISSNKVRLANISSLDEVISMYSAPEIYKNEIFDRSIDAFSFGLILYEMIEGAPPFHPKSPEEVIKMICVEGNRPSLKNKVKSYPSDLKELIEECWDPQTVVRPTFSEVIIRLDKIYANCAKQGRWKDTFKLPWPFAVSDKVSCVEALRGAISSLPDSVDSTLGTVLPSDSERRRKLEFLEMQEALIKEEERERALAAQKAEEHSVNKEREELLGLVNKEIEGYNLMLAKEGSARSVHEAKEAYEKARGALGYKPSSELAKKVDCLLEELEKEIDDVDAIIGSQEQLLDKDRDGKVTSEELAAAAVYFKENLDKARNETQPESETQGLPKITHLDGKVLVEDIVKLGSKQQDAIDSQNG